MQQLSKKEQKSGMKQLMVEGTATAAKDSVISNYLTPLALALGATNAQIGFLNSLPQLFGNLIQPAAGKYIETRGGKKSTTLIMHALASMIILIIALLPLGAVENKIFFLIVFAIMYQTILNFGSTSWMSWIADIIPEKTRGEFFGKRNMLAGIVSLAVSFFAGWILSVVDAGVGFSIIFGVAAVAGFISYMILRNIPKSPQAPHGHFSLGMRNFFKEFRQHKNFFNFTLYIFFLNFGVYIAAPFFIVFVLRDLQIGYFEYAVAVAVEAIAAIASQRYWGRLSDKFGDRTILGVGGILIAFVPIVFIFVNDFWSLAIAQIFAGFVWAGFDLGRFNFLLDATPPQRRPSFIANHRLLTGMMIFAGGITGGFLATAFASVEFLFLSGLKLLFFVAFVLRILPAMFFIPMLREQRVPASQVVPVKNIFWRAVAVYPAQGILHELGWTNHCIACWERDTLRKIKSKLKS